MRERPKGSGLFALAVGLVALGTASLMANHDFVFNVSPQALIRSWMYFVSAILVYWGVRRLFFTGEGGWHVIGQNTFNFVVGLIAATFALLAILIA